MREGDSAEQHAALTFLMGLYWKPVFFFTRRQGVKEEEAKDLTQTFFLQCLHRELFSKADPVMGRFRSFLIRSLKNFLNNSRKYAAAGIRRPAGGLVSIDELAADEGTGFEPRENETAEDVFNRAWATEVIRQVLRMLEAEYLEAGKSTHVEIFRQRIVFPMLEGAEAPALAVLGARLGISEKQAGACLVTTRRAYQRLLRDFIRQYAVSDADLREEVRDLFQVFDRS